MDFLPYYDHAPSALLFTHFGIFLSIKYTGITGDGSLHSETYQSVFTFRNISKCHFFIFTHINLFLVKVRMEIIKMGEGLNLAISQIDAGAHSLLAQ
jgi:hypothetical protein